MNAIPKWKHNNARLRAMLIDHQLESEAKSKPKPTPIIKGEKAVRKFLKSF